MDRVIYVQQPVVQAKPYGCMTFMGDVFMTVLTGGFWLIWIFVREMRKKRT